MSGTIMSNPLFTGLDNNGTIMAGGLLYTYLAGSATPATTYTDSALAVPNANPIVLDSAGRAVIYLDAQVAYKFELRTAAGATIWTQDNIGTVILSTQNVDVPGTAGGTVLAGKLVAQDTSTGTWAEIIAGAVTYNNLGFATTGNSAGQPITVRVAGRVTGLSGLTAGTVYYAATGIGNQGKITSVAPAAPRIVGQADSTTSLVMTPFLLPPDATITYAGLVNTATQGFTGQKQFDLAPQWKPGTSLTYAATAVGTIYTDSASHGNVNTGATVLSTTTLKGNSLAAGKTIRITAKFTLANNANQKTIKFYLGTTAITALSASVVAAVAGTAEVLIMGTGAAAEDVTSTILLSGQNPIITHTTFAETLSGDLTVKSEGTSNTASNDIVQTQFVVEVVG